MQNILGMIGYSSSFIPNYSTLTAPLRELIRKSKKYQWKWGQEQQAAFTKLENALKMVLAYFGTNKDTIWD